MCRNSAKGFTIIELLFAMSVVAAAATLILNNGAQKRHSAYLDLTEEAAESALLAVEQVYFSYCNDPLNAPPVSGDFLVDNGYVVQSQSLQAPLLSAPIVPNIDYTPPQFVSVTLLFRNTNDAIAISKRFSNTSRSNSSLTIRRIPSLYNPQMAQERATFYGLFHTPTCVM